MRMRLLRLCAVVLAAGVVASTRAENANDSAALLGRVHSAEVATSLDVAGIKPWHLKATVQLFDSKGNPADRGTLEEWWASPDLDRREYKVGAYSATEIRIAGKTYRTRGADLPPYYLELLRSQIVHPVGLPPTANPQFPKLRKEGNSKVPLECIELKSSKNESGANTYCFGAKSNDLAASIFYTYQLIAREAIGDFQGRRVSVSTTVSYNRVKAATATIDSLGSASIPSAEFEITPDVDLQIPLWTSSDSDDPPTEPILRPDADFPDLGQAGDAAGLLLRCVIAKDGLVREIEVIGATDPRFVKPALAAYRKWKYKPINWHGQPAEAEIMIAVDVRRD